MSQKLSVLTITDFEKIRSELSRVFHVNAPAGWVLLRYTAGTTLALQASSPNGTVADLIKQLDDSQVQYALIRLPTVGDQPSKDLFLTWVGCNVSKIERGKKSEHLADAKTVLSPSHIDLTALTRVGFTEAKLRELSDPSSGSHVLKPLDDQEERKITQATQQADAASRNQFVEKQHKVAEEKKKVLNTTNPSPRGGSGATRKLTVLTLQDADEVDKGLAGLLNKNVHRGWIVVRYVGATTIGLQAVGIESTIDQLVGHLEENQIQYALIRIPPVHLETPKDVFLTWVGPKVSKIEQAKKTEHLADMKEILKPAHCQLSALTKVGFTEQKLRELADPAAGSHVLKLPDQ